jgi:hypothetical protein
VDVAFLEDGEVFEGVLLCDDVADGIEAAEGVTVEGGEEEALGPVEVLEVGGEGDEEEGDGINMRTL